MITGEIEIRTQRELTQAELEWKIYQKEFAKARQIEDEQLRQCTIRDIEKKFRRWMYSIVME